jgi:hypothetical protein
VTNMGLKHVTYKGCDKNCYRSGITVDATVISASQ